MNVANVQWPHRFDILNCGVKRPRTKRTIVALEALEVALAQLSSLPESPESEALMKRGFELQREVKKWADDPVSPVERERMMKKVLALHMAIGRLVSGS